MTRLLSALAEGFEVRDLGRPLETGIPCSPNHPGFRMALLRRHGDMVRDDGSSASNELIITGGHVGTHMDALAHVSYRGHLHGGVATSEALKAGRYIRHGADELPATLRRGVLLDVARAKSVDTLPGGYGITPEDLELAEQQADVEVSDGDAVLVRSGWGRLWSDSDAYVGHATGVPGPNEAGARWLADRGVAVTGADTIAYEQITSEMGHGLLPAHRLLLVERGIPIIEVLNLEDISADGIAEFCLVLAPLNVVGATGAPVRPLAITDGPAARTDG